MILTVNKFLKVFKKHYNKSIKKGWSTMKILDVPTVSTSEVKKNPTKIAKMAAELNTGIYVLNRGKALSVTLTPEQYQQLVADQEALLDLKTEQRALTAIQHDTGTRLSENEAIGHALPDEIDSNDGWE
jgi:hypothetical protein